MTQAISPGCSANSRSTLARSLYRKVSVSASVPAGMPPGMPVVTMNQSL